MLFFVGGVSKVTFEVATFGIRLSMNKWFSTATRELGKLMIAYQMRMSYIL